MADWRLKLGATPAVIAATANYWRPVLDPWETVCQVGLVNPYFVRPWPGRKTDTAACIWLAQLWKQGLVRPSFMPPREIGELRDRRRQRAARVEQAVLVAHAWRQCREKAHLKWDSVLSDLLGGAAGR